MQEYREGLLLCCGECQDTSWFTCLTGDLKISLITNNCLIFRGYKFFFGAGQNVVRFPDRMQAMNQQSGGQVIARFPCDLGDPWYDWQGVSHQAPVRPANLQHAQLMFEVQVNSARMFCTAHRGGVERSFAKDWAKQIMGSRYAIPHQYLESYGKPPTPNVSKMYVITMVNMAVDVSRCGVGHTLVKNPNVQNLLCRSLFLCRIEF